jgi:ADP-heptose:LPS heptosyltransferase
VKIVVIAFGLLGDVLMRTPFLRELRAVYPSAKITAIVDPIGRDVLLMSGLVDEIIVSNRSKESALRYLLSKISLHWKMFVARADLVIDLYGGKSSRFLAAVSGCKKKVLIHSGIIECEGLDRQPEKIQHTNPYHLSNVLLDGLSCFAMQPGPFSTRPFVVRPRLEDVRLDSGLSEEISSIPSLLVSMGSGDPEKILSLEKVAEVLAHANAHLGYWPLLVCNPGQEELQDRLSLMLDQRRVSYFRLPLLGLREIAHIMTKVKFVMLPDTGLYHLAVGIGVPIFGLFTHTNPELVRPERGIYEIAFQEDPDKGLDQFGLPYGTRDLPVSELIVRVESLVQRIIRNETLV